MVLNLLGGQSADRATGATDREVPPPWLAAARTAQGKLDSLARRASGRDGRVRAPELLSRGSVAILAELARRAARKERGRGRRTRHAQERHASGKRPTRTAVQDLHRASADDVMVDERSGALVVAGPRGRTHFFNPEGRLISSVRYEPEELERKRKAGRWRRARAAEAQTLRSRVGDRTSPAR